MIVTNNNYVNLRAHSSNLSEAEFIRMIKFLLRAIKTKWRISWNVKYLVKNVHTKGKQIKNCYSDDEFFVNPESFLTNYGRRNNALEQRGQRGIMHEKTILNESL